MKKLFTISILSILATFANVANAAEGDSLHICSSKEETESLKKLYQKEPTLVKGWVAYSILNLEDSRPVHLFFVEKENSTPPSEGDVVVFNPKYAPFGSPAKLSRLSIFPREDRKTDDRTVATIFPGAELRVLEVLDQKDAFGTFRQLLVECEAM